MSENVYLELLSEFESLPFQSETVFDIAGFPHYENVCSNILKFYLKIILGLRKELESSEFRSVTYKELWAEIKKRVGNYVSTSSQKWLLYLVDFMTSIEKLNGGNMELNETDKFFIKNVEKVNALINAKNEFDSKLYNKVSELFEITNKIEPYPQCKKIWIYRKSCLVYDFKLGNNSEYDVAFDLYLYPSGWVLQAFWRGNPSHSYLRELFELAPLCDFKDKVKYENSRPTIELKPNNLNTDLNEIKQQLFEWVDRIFLAEKNKQQGQTNTISQV